MSERISAELVARSALRPGNVALDGGDVYWVEGRPAEGGRSVVVRRAADGSTSDATPAGTNVRTRVQEYGGAPFIVSGGTIYYSEFSDQRLYRMAPGGSPQPITPDGPWRYADAAIDPQRARLICVREENRGRELFSDGDTRKIAPDPETTLVAIPLDGEPSCGEVIESGFDFYSTPRFSPDGSQLVWLAWRHPQMPWDGTELWLADIAADGSLAQRRLVAGGDRESIFQPGWSPDGTLHFVSDRTGWWNLYRVAHGRIENVHPIDADCGRPQWVLGSATWAFAGETLVLAWVDEGVWRLTRPVTSLEPGEFLAASGSHVVFVGGAADTPDGVFRVDLTDGHVETLRTAGEPLDPARVSRPRAIEFQTTNGLTAHAFYYRPAFAEATAGRLLNAVTPPLMVVSHGGPTSAASARLNLEIQFWTSHGFAVVDVNYGGSTGFGRAYRERLNGQWGVVDVADCVNAARHLARQGLADARRVVIRGRSAGGFTTLAALTSHPEVFAAGAIYYGIGDLELLVRDTHKFESRYLDRLVGPYPGARDLYRARSPIHHVDRLACPLVVFQGMDDRVVPPEHAYAIVNAVRAKGIPVELHEFPGEGHGFRKAETIVRCLNAELAFYERNSISARAAS